MGEKAQADLKASDGALGRKVLDMPQHRAIIAAGAGFRLVSGLDS